MLNRLLFSLLVACVAISAFGQRPMTRLDSARIAWEKMKNETPEQRKAREEAHWARMAEKHRKIREEEARNAPTVEQQIEQIILNGRTRKMTVEYRNMRTLHGATYTLDVHINSKDIVSVVFFPSGGYVHNLGPNSEGYEWIGGARMRESGCYEFILKFQDGEQRWYKIR